MEYSPQSRGPPRRSPIACQRSTRNDSRDSSSMRTSILTAEDELRTRLERLAWHATRHARTTQERLQVESLCDAVVRGVVPKRDAYEALSALRGEQQAA